MTIIYKPSTSKGPVFLVSGSAKSPPTITAGGQTYVGKYHNTINEGSGANTQFVFPSGVLGHSDATLSYGGKTQSLGNTNMSYRGSAVGALSESSKGAVGSGFAGGGGGAYGGMGSNVPFSNLGLGGTFNGPIPRVIPFGPGDSQVLGFSGGGTPGIYGNDGQLVSALSAFGSNPYATGLSAFFSGFNQASGTVPTNPNSQYGQAQNYANNVSRNIVNGGQTGGGLTTRAATDANGNAVPPTQSPDYQVSGKDGKVSTTRVQPSSVNSPGADQVNNDIKNKLGLDTIKVGGAGAADTVLPTQTDFSALGNFTPVQPSPIPKVQSPLVDPMMVAGRYGDFNVKQYLGADKIAEGQAGKILGTELAGLNAFVPGVGNLIRGQTSVDNQFNRGEIDQANTFNRNNIYSANQSNFSQLPQVNGIDSVILDNASKGNQIRRTAGIDSALPQYRKILGEQTDRARTLASGRLPNSIEDAAYGNAARSSSADASTFGGFGSQSTFGKKASDIFSAQQRLDVSKYGDQALSQAQATGFNTLYNPVLQQNPLQARDVYQNYTPLGQQPNQANVGGQVRVMPENNAGSTRLKISDYLTKLSTIDPANALSSMIGQNQFNANLLQNRNLTLGGQDLESQMFNSKMQRTAAEDYLSATSGQNIYNRDIAQGAVNSAAGTEARDYANSLQREQESKAKKGGGFLGGLNKFVNPVTATLALGGLGVWDGSGGTDPGSFLNNNASGAMSIFTSLFGGGFGQAFGGANPQQGIGNTGYGYDSPGSYPGYSPGPFSNSYNTGSPSGPFSTSYNTGGGYHL